jgi:hypothetical protein
MRRPTDPAQDRQGTSQGTSDAWIGDRSIPCSDSDYNPQRSFGQFNARWRELNRTPRRQRLVKHLIECGARPVLEALLAVDAGQDLDVVLEDFCRLSPETYQSVGADVMPIDEAAVIEGGRR